MTANSDSSIAQAAEFRRDAFDKIPIKCPPAYAEGYSPQPSVLTKGQHDQKEA